MSFFKKFFILGGLSCLSSCTSTIAYRNQEIPASINISQEKDTVVVLHFRNDDYRIAQTLEDRLKAKNFKTMPEDMYYEYKKELTKKTHFVLLNGNVSGHVSSPQVSETIAEECGRDPRGYPIHRFNFSEDIRARINTALTFTGTEDGPYNTSIEGYGVDHVDWTQCGRTPPPHFRPPRADSKPAIKQARHMIGAEFDKIIDRYWISIPVTLFTADKKIIPAMTAGNYQFASGNLTEAVKFYKEAVKQSKANPNAKPSDIANCYYNLGITQGYLGDEEAFQNLDEAYKLNPNQEYLKNRNVMNEYFEINKNLND